MKRILITGVTGFIGSHIAKRLISDGYEVCAIIRKNANKDTYRLPKSISYSYYDGTLDSMVDILRLQRPDCVIHLAAKFVAEHNKEQVDELLNSNIILSAHLLEAMRLSGCRYLLNTTSSWEHYQDEEYNPVCLYAATKRAVSDLLKYYCEAEGMKALTLSIYDTYGSDDQRGKLLTRLLEIGESGEKLAMSEGAQTVNYVYIDDVVNAYITALSMVESLSDPMKTYEVRTDEIYTLRELCELFQGITGMHLAIDWGGRPYRKREVMRVYTGGIVLPGWKAKTKLPEGIQRLYIDYKHHQKTN